MLRKIAETCKAIVLDESVPPILWQIVFIIVVVIAATAAFEFAARIVSVRESVRAVRL